jgi:hypothetical protein
LLATGIFATVAIAMLALLKPASEAAGRASEDDEVSRLIPAVQDRLRNEDPATVKSWIDGALPLFAYAYRTDLEKRREPDGSPEPASAAGIPGRDGISATAVRPEGDPHLEADLAALEGRIYQIDLERLAQIPAPPAGQSGPVTTVLCRLKPVPFPGANPGRELARFPAAIRK